MLQPLEEAVERTGASIVRIGGLVNPHGAFAARRAGAAIVWQIVDSRVSGTGFISHDYFHSNPAVSSDLILLLRYHRLPGAENGRPLGHEESGFWFINDSYPRAATEAGDLQTERDWKVEPTRVEKGASIGSGATILSNVVIGEHAIVGAGSVVTRDVPPRTIVAGNPARVLRALTNLSRSSE